MRRVMLVLLLVLGLTACGTEQLAPGGEGPEPDAELSGEWELVDGVEVVKGHPITLRVEGGEVGGVAACNSYGGTVTIDGDRFSVGDIARTEMGCPAPGVHESERAYLDALLVVERYERDGEQLVLRGPDVQLRFDQVPPEEGAPLTGTEWQLESLMSGDGPDGAVSSTMAPAWLRLDDDRSFTGFDGCNELFGSWTLDGDVLHLGEVGTTDMACPDIQQQATHVLDVLTGEPAVEHEGRRLRLSIPGQGLDYRAG